MSTIQNDKPSIQYYSGDFLTGENPTHGEWQDGIFTSPDGLKWKLAVEPDRINWRDGSPVDGSGVWPMIPA